MTTAQTSKAPLLVDKVIYVLLSLALVSHALDIYRHFPIYYGLSLLSGAIAALSVFLPLKPEYQRRLLLGQMVFHSLVILTSLPDLTNHEVMLLVIYVSFFVHVFKKSTAPLAAVPLVVILFWMYFWSTFHKFNSDFFFASYSCSQTMFYKLGGWTLSNGEITAFSMGVIAVEGLLAATLLFRHRRGAFLVLAFLFHSLLLFLDVAPFTANLYALLILLLPAAVQSRWLETTASRDLKIYVICVIVGLCGFEWGLYSLPLWQAIFLREFPFLLGALPAFFSIRRIYRASIPIFPPVPWGRSVALHLFLFLWGFQTYLGLRTNGTFNMYSNLMTETKGNHFLVPPSWSRWFPYQSDLVMMEFSTFPKHWKLQRLHRVWVPRVTLDNLSQSLRRVDGPIAGRVTTSDGSFSTVDLAFETHPLWLPKTYNFTPLTRSYLDMRPTQTSRCEW